MCGIIGYVGAEAAIEHLTEGLERLAYRGYDSAGVAVALDGGDILTVKASGRLEALRARLREHPEAAAAHCGMHALGISCVTNFAAGVTGAPMTEEEVLETSAKATAKFSALIDAVIRRL
jgi:purine nucleoside phosphorylase